MPCIVPASALAWSRQGWEWSCWSRFRSGIATRAPFGTVGVGVDKPGPLVAFAAPVGYLGVIREQFAERRHGGVDQRPDVRFAIDRGEDVLSGASHDLTGGGGTAAHFGDERGSGCGRDGLPGFRLDSRDDSRYQSVIVIRVTVGQMTDYRTRWIWIWIAIRRVIAGAIV